MKYLLQALLTASVFIACAEEAPRPGTEGASCPNDRNCLSPLVCVEGTCRPPDAQPDAGVPDDAGQLAPDVGVADAGPQPYIETLTSGPAAIMPDGQTLGYAISGRAAMLREASGYTDIVVQISGVTTGETEFSTHVHAKACGDEDGGPHYKIDDTIAEVVPDNEIWPTITVGPEGEGLGRVRVSHYARPEAQSVIIHEPAEGRRIYCFDLAADADITASGTLYPLPDGAAEDISGTAELRRYSGGTQASVNFTGTLQPDALYPVHVHAKACDDEVGGPHYKIDEAITEVIVENEIWPMAMANTEGTAAAGTYTVSTHVARFSAVSVVVHNPDDGNRIACADLKLSP